MPDDSQSKVVRTRAKHFKVRSGCITCRTRRVKCDEAKPKCSRCQRAGWDCEGYAKPQLESGWRSASAANSATRRLRLLKPSQEPSFALFETEVEGRYYRLFVERTAASLGGYYGLDLWCRTIPQTSVGTSSIRHAVIALAALDLTSMAALSKISTCSTLDRRRAGGDAHSRHQFALQQYSKAIKEMREDIAKATQDLRTTLLATILLVTFESYHGNYQAALQQFLSGRKVLEEWNAAHSDPDEDFGTPSPHLIEGGILSAFHQLETQISLHGDFLPLEAHMRLKESGAAVMKTTPSVFQTVNEAVLYGTTVMRRCVHFLSMSWVYDDGASAAPSSSFSILDRISGWSNAEGFRQQKKYIKELERFYEAFLPFLQKVRTPAGRKDFVDASVIYLHYLVAYTTVTSMFATSEMSYDTLNPLFREIFTLSKIVLHTSAKSNFTTACGAIMPLEFLGKKCRDRTMRREAIRLLLATPRRECLRDSVISAKVCLWVMNIEEEGMVDGHIPEEARVRSISAEPRPDESRLYVSCRQMKKGSSEMVLREGTIAL